MKKLDTELLDRTVSERAETDVKDGNLGGAEIIVCQDGKRVYHKTFGYSKAGGPALEKGRLFRVASMTKPLGAAAVLCACDQGLCDLYDPIEKYLPGFSDLWVGRVENNKVIRDHRANGPVRLFQLLSHCSGVSSDPLAVYQETWAPYDSPKALAEAFSHYCVAFEPYTKTMYSTAAFDVAAHIVEILSEMRFDDFLKKYITDPLGMRDTTFFPDPEQRARFISVDCRRGDGTHYDAVISDKYVYDGIPMECMSAGAGIASTAEDYIHFAEMLLNEGVTPDGTRVLSAESVKEMKKPQVTPMIMPEPGFELWGLGVRVITADTYPHGLEKGCFGWSGAYGSHFWVDPNNRITAVYMKNDRYDGGAGCRTACNFEKDVASSLINEQ